MAAIVKSEERGDEPAEKTNRLKFWDESAKLRPEIAVPGYWESLQENCDDWARYASVGPLWNEVKKKIPIWSNEFYAKTGGALLSLPDLPDFRVKGVDRIREKICHRALSDPEYLDIGKAWNACEPAIPAINDMVRTRVVCKFLDGVEFFASRLEEAAQQMGIKVSREREGKLQGYFAQHLVFEQNVFFRRGEANRAATISCEVQIATILATRIWDESHLTYEQSRTRAERSEEWQWNPEDPRFIARQLGHMIHLADGLLVQLRNSTKK